MVNPISSPHIEAEKGRHRSSRIEVEPRNETVRRVILCLTLDQGRKVRISYNVGPPSYKLVYNPI